MRRRRVVADYYNRTLQRHGKVDTFSVITTKARAVWRAPTKALSPATSTRTSSGSARTRSAIGFIVRVHLARVWSSAPCWNTWRGGNYTVQISASRPKAISTRAINGCCAKSGWMKINGEGIYASTARKIIGEVKPVDSARTNQPPRLKTPPGRGGMGQAHADFKFSEQDFRFTVGKDGSLYAWCMTLPKPGTTLTIKSLGADAKLLASPIKSVTLLGSKARLIGNRLRRAWSSSIRHRANSRWRSDSKSTYEQAQLGNIISVAGRADSHHGRTAGRSHLLGGSSNQVAKPVLQALAEERLKRDLPVHEWERNRANFTGLEALGRTMAGIAPWLELGPDETPEGKLRAEFIELAVKAIAHAPIRSRRIF